jgi:hypothetical protein
VTGREAGWAAAGERGAAVVELLVVMLVLLVPLVYVMVVMADVQRALLATSSAAREAGRVYVTGADRVAAERRAGWRIGRCWPPMGCARGTGERRCGCGSGTRLRRGRGALGGSGPGRRWRWR